jgi:putative transposase
MARLQRVYLEGVPQHIIHRGNNRQACFSSEEDFIAYAGWLKEYAKKHEVAIHAWVFMTNHVHILGIIGVRVKLSYYNQGLSHTTVRIWLDCKEFT